MISPKMFAQIEALGIDDLKQLNSYVVRLIKEARLDTAYEMKNSLRVGDNVKVSSPKVAGLKGVVTQINRTRCKVKFGHTTYNVPMSMVWIIK